MSRMYTILLAMKPRFERADWLRMVELAQTRAKITKDEYAALVKDEAE